MTNDVRAALEHLCIYGRIAKANVALITERLAALETERTKLRNAWLDIWEIFCDGEGADIDHEAFLTVAMDTGLVVKEPYDPEIHTGHIWGDVEPGDEIYVLSPPAQDGKVIIDGECRRAGDARCHQDAGGLCFHFEGALCPKEGR